MFDKNFYCVSSRIENSGQLYGCFKIGPFSRHQSLTFANALRRTLLADRSRCTLSAVQIHDVEHEFSSLMGVRESVVDILLNLEKLIFKIKKPITKPQVAFINFCGPGILRAQHIYLPSNFQCVRPSQYIATLEVDGKLTLKLFFSPDWNKLKFFIQNFIFATKEDSKSDYFQNSNQKKTGLAASTRPGAGRRAAAPGRPPSADRQKNIQKLRKYTNPSLFKEIYRYRSILHRKMHPLSKAPRSANTFRHSVPSGRSTLSAKSIEKEANRPLARKTRWESANRPKARSAPSQKTWASAFSMTQILKNRLKIVYSLTNILFKMRQSRYLQRLNVQFQFLNLKTMTIQKLPWPIWRSQSDPQIFSSAHPPDHPKKVVPYRTVQYSKQHTETNDKTISFRTGLADGPTRRQDVSPVFAQKIQENFLFLNGSQCAIEKVNYTLQSQILGASASEENPHPIWPFDQRMTPFSFDPKEPSAPTSAKDDSEIDRPLLSRGDDPQAASSPCFAGSEETGRASRRGRTMPGAQAWAPGVVRRASIKPSTDLSKGFPREAADDPPNHFKKYKRIHHLAEKNIKIPLKYHLKLHSPYHIQRKLRGNIPRHDAQARRPAGARAWGAPAPTGRASQHFPEARTAPGGSPLPGTALVGSRARRPGAKPRSPDANMPTLGHDRRWVVSTSERPDRVASPVWKKMNHLTGRADPISPSHKSFRARQAIWEDASKKARRLLSKNEEFILFEIWTDGSILPQTALLRALNELLIEIFPYSLQISQFEKVHSMMATDRTIGAQKYAGGGRPLQQVESTERPFDNLNRKNALKFIPNSLKKRNSDLSKKSFREKFLNLEIGNFYFDLETYLFLKKQKIHRIIDFFKFLNQKETTKWRGSPPFFKHNRKTKEIKITLDQFQIFLNSLIG